MSQSPSRRPGRPAAGSENKRERILQEAALLFGRAGYTATSLSDVALAAEISKAGLLHHFDSKEGLFSAVLERRDTEDLKWFEGDTENVWTFLDRFAEVIDNNASRPGMVGLYTAMTMGALDRDHPAHPWLHQHLTRSVDYLAEQFERGKNHGSMDPDAPSYELARTVVSVADGIQLQWLCARADTAGDDELQPVHGEAPLDMAAQVRLLTALIRARWAPSPEDRP